MDVITILLISLILGYVIDTLFTLHLKRKHNELVDYILMSESIIFAELKRLDKK